MSAYVQWRRAAWAAAFLVLALTAWIVFAPMQVGGQSAYVVIDGNSMEPRFHWGDLVIIHQAPGYQVGDMVAYKNAQLQRFVFHRIIGTNGNHFILRGDHNTWDDSYQPVQSEVVGVFWSSLPRVGAWILWLRQPLHLGVAAGMLGALLALSFFRRRARNGTAMEKSTVANWLGAARLKSLREFFTHIRGSRLLDSAGAPRATRPAPNDSDRSGSLRKYSGTLEALVFALAMLFFGSLILGYFAFTRPLVRTVEADISYQHVGTFSYAAAAPSGIYDSRSVQSGDPVFPALTCNVDMRFSYALAGIQPQSLNGTYQLFAKILDPQSGWQRTLPLTEVVPFTGTSFVARAPVNLCQVEDLVAGMQKATGLGAINFVLRVAPVVTLTGSVSGVAIEDTYRPTLDFRFDPAIFWLVRDDPKANLLNASQAAVIKRSISEPNTIPILGRDFNVGRLRLLSGLGFLLSLAGLAALAYSLASLAHQGEAALAEIKYGSLLVDARQRNLLPATDTVEIASLDDLARLAERNQTMILYEKRDRINFYWVQGQGRTYRYAIAEGLGGAPSVPLVQLEDQILQGLERGEFEVYYQPIQSLSDDKVFGVEALLRWQHPEHGLIPAAQFVPAAEAAGLMNPLGDWLLGVACQQVQAWHNQGIPLMLSVNLCEQQLRGDPGSSFRRVLQNVGLDPHCLQVEIPAPESMHLPDTIVPKLQDLKDLGIQISVGESTGSTALSSISQFPLTGIKFERPVVERIDDQTKALAVERMIKAARGRGLQVGAVGVETEEQMQFLRAQRCNFAQGYLVGRPVSAEQLESALLAAKPDSLGGQE